MSATSRWIVPCSTAALLLVGPATPVWAQGNDQKRSPESVGDRQRPAAARIPATQSPSTPLVKKHSIVEMPAVNGGTAFDRPFRTTKRLGANPAIDSPWMNPVFAARGPVVINVIRFPTHHPGWQEPLLPQLNARNWPARNPFVVNPMLVNPLQRPLLDPFNGPGQIAGGMALAARLAPRGEPSAESRKSVSLLDEVQESPSSSSTIYQPISGIVTLADGSTFYRATGSSAATELGNYTSGGGLDAGLLSGNFFSPGLGSIAALADGNGFLPYVW